MLDLSGNMNERDDFEQDDDLFTAGEEEITATVTQIEEKKAPAPKRTVVKPPVLPKYEQPEKPEKKTILPVLKNNPHFLHRKRKSEEFSTEDKMEVSRILKAARSAAGLSVEDVEKATQIRARYMTALEEGAYDSLPRPVYVLAYLRKLCELYDIPEDEEELLIRPWRNIPCELPENLTNSIQQDAATSDRKVLHQIEVAILAVGAVIIIGILVLVVVLVISFINKKTVPELSFDNTKLLELQEKPQLKITE
ncbi:MAG: helix-turn-helix domain-containing protein [Lentisphaeria bacterium]|nr:helix-turn-helix domain-containing protein [Lentisphaeria bacterium]